MPCERARLQVYVYLHLYTRMHCHLLLLLLQARNNNTRGRDVKKKEEKVGRETKDVYIYARGGEKMLNYLSCTRITARALYLCTYIHAFAP